MCRYNCSRTNSWPIRSGSGKGEDHTTCIILRPLTNWEALAIKWLTIYIPLLFGNSNTRPVLNLIINEAALQKRVLTGYERASHIFRYIWTTASRAQCFVFKATLMIICCTISRCNITCIYVSRGIHKLWFCWKHALKRRILQESILKVYPEEDIKSIFF